MADVPSETNTFVPTTDDMYCVQWLNINAGTWEPEPIPLYKIGRGLTGREKSVHAQGPVKFVVVKVWKGAGELEPRVHFHPRLARFNKRWGAGIEWFRLDWCAGNEDVVSYLDTIVRDLQKGE